MPVTWALFRKPLDKDSKWEFRGFAEHDELVTEFEESNEEEHTTAIVCLED
jgi:hypothetical protein